MFLHISKANYIKEYIIEVIFSDGRTGLVDLRDSFHGSAFQKLNNIEYFSKLSVDGELKTIVWSNGVDLAPEYLYFKAFKDIPELQGQFEKRGYKEKTERKGQVV